ncbi:uncharacterized protein LOC125769223 [Anopheles funestus]|uniref:uncharacterized protein LOC125769223 n=1 Tax=Anopheles funestus TaxID=62324 RepID=UPI0020C70223|nr:uncharacterized protein LOC125769223 [Anopheles funestus]
MSEPGENLEQNNDHDTDMELETEAVMDSSTTQKRKLRTTSNIDRERVINAHQKGCSAADIAARMLNINRSTVYSIIKKFDKTFEVKAAKRGGDKEKKISPDIGQKIRDWIDENCTITLQQLADKVFDDFGIRVSKPTVAREIKSFRYSLKWIQKIPERRNNPQTLEIRKEYASRFYALPGQVADTNVIFVDEVGFCVSMRASRGRSAVGTPAVKIVSQIRTRNVSIICAMNRSGIQLYKTAERSVNRDSFLEFMRDLKQKLTESYSGRIIYVMDNVAFHKCSEIRQAIEDDGDEVRYLPPYSPFLNPIENLFSKWKEITKRANANNDAELIEAIDRGASLVTSSDCEGYIRNMWTYLHRCLNLEEICD